MPSWFVAITLSFYFDSSKVFVFVDAHGVRVEDAIDVSLYFMEISCYYYSPLVIYISRHLIVKILTILNYNFVIKQHPKIFIQ